MSLLEAIELYDSNLNMTLAELSIISGFSIDVLKAALMSDHEVDSDTILE
mgnify:CR=1 FL=1